MGLGVLGHKDRDINSRHQIKTVEPITFLPRLLGCEVHTMRGKVVNVLASFDTGALQSPQCQPGKTVSRRCYDVLFKGGWFCRRMIERFGGVNNRGSPTPGWFLYQR